LNYSLPYLTKNECCNFLKRVSGLTPTQADQSKRCCPFSAIAAGERRCPPLISALGHKRAEPDPNASQAKQAPMSSPPLRVPPPLQTSVSGPTPTQANRCERRCSPHLPAPPLPTSTDAPPATPQHCHCRCPAALPPLPKQLRCSALPIFVWKLGGGGKLFGKAEGCNFFLKWY
jgi:hypothetical protein